MDGRKAGMRHVVGGVGERADLPTRRPSTRTDEGTQPSIGPCIS